MSKKRVTNAQFVKSDAIFQKACELASIPVTLRQASKWRNNKGLAHKFKNQATKDK